MFAANNAPPSKESVFAVYPLFCPTIISSGKNCDSVNTSTYSLLDVSPITSILAVAPDVEPTTYSPISQEPVCTVPREFCS